MPVVYLCLTCLKVSDKAGDCHDHPMIRCGNDGPEAGNKAERLDLGYHDSHWLVRTVAELHMNRLDDRES